MPSPGGDRRGKRRLVPTSAPREERADTADRAPAQEERPRREERGGRSGPPGRSGGPGGRGGGGGGRGGSGRYGGDRKGGRGGPRSGAPRDFDPVVETLPPEPLPSLQRRERRMHVVSELPSDPRYGKRPEDRTVEELLDYGFIVLDKPRGPTSHQTVAWLRDLLGVEKVGHGGTLDPKVSGVLPTTLGEATKAVGALLTAGKEYVTVVRLHADADEETIRREAARFIGRVRQVPPVRSAVARRGRIRRIYDLEVLDVDGRDVLVRVACEAGTYIRNLAIDLGRAIGTRGHMAELRRTRTGLFGEDIAVSLTEVKDAVHFWRDDGDPSWLSEMLIPYERVLSHLPQVRLRDSAVDAVCHGADLAAPGIAAIEDGIQEGDAVALMSGKGEAVALATAVMGTDAALAAETGNVAVLDRVLMKPGTYPSSWKRQRTETRRVE